VVTALALRVLAVRAVQDRTFRAVSVVWFKIAHFVLTPWLDHRLRVLSGVSTTLSAHFRRS